MIGVQFSIWENGKIGGHDTYSLVLKGHGFAAW